jgi:hypothetical protein
VPETVDPFGGEVIVTAPDAVGAGVGVNVGPAVGVGPLVGVGTAVGVGVAPPFCTVTVTDAEPSREPLEL